MRSYLGVSSTKLKLLIEYYIITTSLLTLDLFLQDVVEFLGIGHHELSSVPAFRVEGFAINSLQVLECKSADVLEFTQLVVE